MSPRLSGGQSSRRPPEYVCTLAEALIVAAALDAAISWVSNQLIAPCPHCRSDEPCDRHAADLIRAREYRDMRAELGSILPRRGDRWHPDTSRGLGGPRHGY